MSAARKVMTPTGFIWILFAWEQVTHQVFVNRAAEDEIPSSRLQLRCLQEAEDFVQQGLLDARIAAFYGADTGLVPINQFFWRGARAALVIRKGFMPPQGEAIEDEAVFLDRAAFQRLLDELRAAPNQENGGDGLRPMSSVQRSEAVRLLESQTERLTRNRQRELIRQAFPQSKVTETDIRSIFERVPTQTGRPKRLN